MVVQLLVDNYENGDEKRIEAALHTLPEGSDEFWWFSFGALQVFEAHPKPENVPALTFLYKHDLSGVHRERYVEQLIAFDALPEWILAECLHDGYPYTRKRVREYVTARAKT